MRFGYAVCAALAITTGCAGAAPMAVAPVDQPKFLSNLKVPAGFSISVYADNIAGARMMSVSPSGDLFVSAMAGGSVVAFQKDANNDGRPDSRAVFLRGLERPHGLAFGGDDDYFYFAEETRVSRTPYQAGDLEARSRVQTVIRDLPRGGNHFTKTIALGPMDDKLYVSIGSTCNVCVEEDNRRAAVMQFGRDGSGGRLYSTGIRNAVGLAFHPTSHELFGTVNGRDMLGDDFPPETLIRVTDGSFHGWPFANGDKIPDPDFGKGHEKEVEKMVLPAFKFQAHSAALGFCFYSPPKGAAKPFPEEYKNDAFVAFHGSWNRSKKTGYKVVRVKFDPAGKPTAVDDFATGWLQGDNVSGRPVCTAVGPDGSLFISDDMGGRIFRVSYDGPRVP